MNQNLQEIKTRLSVFCQRLEPRHEMVAVSKVYQSSNHFNLHSFRLAHWCSLKFFTSDARESDQIFFKRSNSVLPLPHLLLLATGQLAESRLPHLFYWLIIFLTNYK
ncbi:hypothetical protein CHARACLAT_000264 [Characodon lateralis]|uniref:Uncharacterized protein n=1 Tax=Characodon lateralis TaxID=208331 RepID=A0ABU7EQT1_9TELE|nr:hypothetical protein [Characodon lateralis]